MRLHQVMQEKESLEDEAHLDELTQLYNRRYFNKLLSKEMASHKVDRLGFLMLDVDYFKEYNDTYGHAKGDEVLQTVAQILQQHTSEHILACRFGGDEFVCLCVNQGLDAIQALAAGIQRDLDRAAVPHGASECAQVVTVSMGAASEQRDHIQQIEAVLQTADEALYQSKLRGRNTYTVVSRSLVSQHQ